MIYIIKVLRVRLGKIFSYLWNSKALPSAKFFAWCVLKWKVTIKVNLGRRGILQGYLRCPLCTSQFESLSYLFYECKIACLVCNRWFGIFNVIHNQPKDHFY